VTQVWNGEGVRRFGVKKAGQGRHRNNNSKSVQNPTTNPTTNPTKFLPTHKRAELFSVGRQVND
tara:strand:- start:369 stop:560 length:192 start_codon:yes stop_codon:yes gene_type:complete